MADSRAKEEHTKALHPSAAHLAALRAARKLAMTGIKSKFATTTAAAADSNSDDDDDDDDDSDSDSDRDELGVGHKSAKRKRDGSDEEETSELELDESTIEDTRSEKEEGYFYSINEALNGLTSHVSMIDAVVANELKPLAYATVEKLERIEYFLGKQEKGKEKAIKADTTAHYENGTQREKEVVLGSWSGGKRNQRKLGGFIKWREEGTLY